MFDIENIDRAIEWKLRDKFTALGLWPDQRAAISGGLTAEQWTALVDALPVSVNIFGVGSFRDRGQLKRNTVIINREFIEPGTIGSAVPFTFTLKDDKTYTKERVSEGTETFMYEIRFVCDDVELDRVISQVMSKVFETRKYIAGMNADLTNMEDSFWMHKMGQAIDVSGPNFIERVYRYIVPDVVLKLDAADSTVEENIPAVTELVQELNIGPQGYDVQFPDEENNVPAIAGFDMGDYFKDLLEDFPTEKILSLFLYAQKTSAEALRNLYGPQSGVNNGLDFIPFKGFKKTAVGQSLQSGHNLAAYEFTLTNFFYSVFVTDLADAGITELFGLVDGAQNTALSLINDATLKAQGNGPNILLSTIPIKPRTLYTVNRRSRQSLELWEGAKLLGTLAVEPTAVPSGVVVELNVGNENSGLIGTSAGGAGLALSAMGAGLLGREIMLLNYLVRHYMTKTGVIS